MITIFNKPAAQYLDDATRLFEQRLVILGDHPEGRAEMGKVLTEADDTMAINNSARGEYFNWLSTLHSHEAGNHPSFPIRNIHERTVVIGFQTGCESSLIDYTIVADPVGGTSGLFAVIAGLVLGYRTILVAGVRCEPGTIYHDEHVVANWTAWQPIFKGRVTMLGDGWLKELINE